jgi:membrane associated rhomboid family serine protease
MQSTQATAAPNEFRTTDAVKWLIAINVALYFLQLTVVSAADVRGALAFEMRDLDGALWTIGTYMFVHGGAWHLALNMYTLWLFGPRVEAQWGARQFTGYYLLCGFGGWLFHLLFARHGVFLGASAAVMGVMVAYASRWPTERVFLLGVIPLSVRWLVAMMAAVNLVGGVNAGGGDGAGYLAHLGGLVVGWAYLRMVSAMHTDQLRPRVALVADETDEMPRAFPRSLPRQRGERESRPEVDEVVQQSQAAVAEHAAHEPRRAPVRQTPPGGVSASDLNVLLDKISSHGLDALTPAERKRLEDAARRLKDQ